MEGVLGVCVAPIMSMVAAIGMPAQSAGAWAADVDGDSHATSRKLAVGFVPYVWFAGAFRAITRDARYRLDRAPSEGCEHMGSPADTAAIPSWPTKGPERPPGRLRPGERGRLRCA